jgi:aspartyl-tRNA(Asn)/glutamyl-tRNA(Gln) amidotransferase subunit A
LPSLLLDFDVVGPMARTVADVKLLFDILRGPVASDRYSLAAHAARKSLPAGRPLRVLYVPNLENAPVDPQIARSCRQAALRLRDLGHEVSEGSLPLDLGFTTIGWPVVGKMGLAHLFEHHPDWRADTTPKYLALADEGARLPATQLWEILESVKRLRSDSARLFTEIDVVITPAAAALPWPAEEAFPPMIAGQPVGPRGHALFVSWVNAAGLPAIAVPAEPSAEGLPIGIQMIADYGADDGLLDLAMAYEAAAPWASHWPE